MESIQFRMLININWHKNGYNSPSFTNTKLKCDVVVAESFKTNCSWEVVTFSWLCITQLSTFDQNSQNIKGGVWYACFQKPPLLYLDWKPVLRETELFVEKNSNFKNYFLKCKFFKTFPRWTMWTEKKIMKKQTNIFLNKRAFSWLAPYHFVPWTTQTN